jgi:Tfp pilus assembly protein PilF
MIQRAKMTPLAVVAIAAALTGCQTSATLAAGDGPSMFDRFKHAASGLPGLDSLADRSRPKRSSTVGEQPAAPALTEQNFAGVQVAMARSMERDGDLHGAQSTYQAAIRNDPQNVAALHRLALVQEKLGEGDAAEDLLLQAAKLAPGDPEIVCDLGYCYAVRENAAKARMCYEQALKLKPDFSRAHNNLGILLARQGDDENAARHFSAAGLTAAETRTNLGFAHMKRQQWQRADAQLQLALQGQPGMEKAQSLAVILNHLTREDKVRTVAASEAAPAVAAPTSEVATTRPVTATAPLEEVAVETAPAIAVAPWSAPVPLTARKSVPEPQLAEANVTITLPAESPIDDGGASQPVRLTQATSTAPAGTAPARSRLTVVADDRVTTPCGTASHHQNTGCLPAAVRGAAGEERYQPRSVVDLPWNLPEVDDAPSPMTQGLFVR